MGELTDREQELVALGAAIASNCVPCIEYHIPQARKAGFSNIQIKEAVQLADKVRRVPASAVLQAALARIEESLDGSAARGGGRCGCAGSSHDVESGCV